MKKRHTPQALELLVAINQELIPYGFLNASDNSFALGAAEILSASGLKPDEAKQLIKMGLRDQWHKARLLDSGIIYIRRNLFKLRALKWQTGRYSKTGS